MALKSKEELYAFLAEHIDYNPVTGVFKRKKDGKRLVVVSRKAANTSKLNPYACLNTDGRCLKFPLCKLAYYKVNGRLPEQNLRLSVDELQRARRGVVRYAKLEQLSLIEAKYMGSKRSRRNTSGYTGVSYDRQCGRWTAAVYIDRKKVRLGRYDTPEEAAIVVQCYREKHGFLVYHGEL